MPDYRLKCLIRQPNCSLEIDTPVMQMIIAKIINVLAKHYVGFRGISNVYDRHSHMGSYILIFQGKPQHLAKVDIEHFAFEIKDFDDTMSGTFREEGGNLWYFITYTD